MSAAFVVFKLSVQSVHQLQ